MKLKTIHYVILAIISSVLTIQIHTICFTFSEYNFPKSSIVIEQKKVDFLPKPSFINFNQKKEVKQARRKGGKGGGIIIDIRDEDGEITTWGFWLINILAPFFVVGEIIKCFIAFVCLPFNASLANSFFQGALSNFIAMTPGLIVYTLLFILLGILGNFVPEESEKDFNQVDNNKNKTKYFRASDRVNKVKDSNLVLAEKSIKDYFDQAKIHFQQEELDQALEDYNQAIQQNPDDAEAYSNRGFVYAIQGNREQGIKNLEKASTLFQQQGNPKKSQEIQNFLNQVLH